MSYLLPFEVQTEVGWKQAGDLREGDMILCFEEEHGLVYKTIRQCLIYDSNFMFTEFVSGPFRLAICDGTPITPFFHHSMPCPALSVLSQRCQPEELLGGEYNPDPDMVCFGNPSDLDGLQLEAVSKGVHAVIEHCEKLVLRLKEHPFVPVGVADKTGTKAIALSCYEDRPTHFVIRLAGLSDCYKTFSLIV